METEFLSKTTFPQTSVMTCFILILTKILSDKLKKTNAQILSTGFKQKHECIDTHMDKHEFMYPSSKSQGSKKSVSC